MIRRPPDTGDGADQIDFKPFFDMIVGVLFILLVIISGQLYQTRFHGKAPVKDEALLVSERLKREKISQFLQGFQDNLTLQALTNHLDTNTQTVSLPLHQFFELREESVKPKPDVIGTLARALSQSLPCLTTASTAPDACRGKVIDGVVYLSLHVAPPQSGVLPTNLEALTLSLHGRIAEMQPALLRLNARDGQALFKRRYGTMLPPAAGPDFQGSLEFYFDFETAQMQK